MYKYNVSVIFEADTIFNSVSEIYKGPIEM